MRIPEQLFCGPISWFSDWPVGGVPKAGAIVYTVWSRNGAFIYVGMAARDAERLDSSRADSGPWGRLDHHASGKRNHDPFCIGICDRFVLPDLDGRISDMAEGSPSLDVATHDYVRSDLGFRWVAVADGREALSLEKVLQRGDAPSGGPLLNGIPTGED